MSSSEFFVERYRYFKDVLNPVWLFKSKQELHFARDLLKIHENNPQKVHPSDLKWAQTLYASAFHPDTKEINPIVGRMSFQIPGNTIVTALMLTYYRTPMQLLTTQWANQSFMAFSNYTNRNAQSSLTTGQIAAAYLSATGTAVAVSYKLSQVAKRSSNPLASKFVPFFAVCAGNVVNVPLMRQQDILTGITVNDAEGRTLGESRLLGCMCLMQVVASRIAVAIPIMVFPTLAMNAFQKQISKRGKVFEKVFDRPLIIIMESSLIGVCTYFVLPLAVAIFPQYSTVKVDMLERSLQTKMKTENPGLTHVHYNKGL